MIQKRLNHYTIIESLGQGGMGEVYVAEDSKLNRRVALKVLTGPDGFRPRAPRALRARSQGRRRPQSPQHRHHPLGRRGRRCPVPDDGAGGRAAAVVADHAGRHAARCAAANRDRHQRRDRRGAPEGHHPSRLEARERDDHQRWPGEGPRLRSREAARGRARRRWRDADAGQRSDRRRPHHRHHRLHVAGAGRGQGRRPALGHLLARRHAPRDGDGRAAIQGRHQRLGDVGHPQGHAELDHRRQSRAARRTWRA